MALCSTIEKFRCTGKGAAAVNFMVTPCINEYPPLYYPANAHNVKERRVIKTF